MKTIKYKILIKFCLVGVLIFLSFGLAINFVMNSTLTHQSLILSKRLNGLIEENLSGMQNIFQKEIANIGKENKRLIQKLAENPELLKGLELFRITYLNDILEKHSTEYDFAILFDLEGRHIASYPSDTGANVDTKWIEDEYLSRSVRQKLMAHMQNDSEESITYLTTHREDFIRAFRLAFKYSGEETLISYESAGMVADDFGDPLAFLIAGRILNNFSKPLDAFYQATGVQCAVFSDGTAISHMGFRTEEGVEEALTLDPDILKEVYESEKPEYIRMDVLNNRYIAVCSKITASNGNGIGVLMVALDESHVKEIEQEFLSLGRQSKRNLKYWIFGISIVSLLVFIFLSILIAVDIERPLKKVIKGLIKDVSSVASASDQIASSSRKIADGASEQAAAEEETAVSLSEMTEISHSTSELTAGAQRLMEKNIAKSVEAIQLIIRLTQTIRLIEADSDRVSQIIDSIDGIAFQTNLLALNAAVEAARAGNAGAGFAVVADEVRTLAQKAGKAAQNTQELLQKTIQRVALSADAVKKVNTNFDDIVKSATIMGDKTKAITDASKGLAGNISHVNYGVVEISKVSQDNAANAEEFTALSEELHSRACKLEDYVEELSVMVGHNFLKRL